MKVRFHVVSLPYEISNLRDQIVCENIHSDQISPRVHSLLLGRSRVCALAVVAIMRHRNGDSIPAASAQAFHRAQSGGRPHGLPATLILSLTSYPPRFGTLSLTLHSLLRQSVKADRTILWIAHIPLLPKAVTVLQAAGLEIRATEDVRSYKKSSPH